MSLIKLLKKSLNAPAMDHRYADLTLLCTRIFFGLSIAFAHGLKKIPPSDHFIEFVGSLGFPYAVFFAWQAGLSEFVGGICIALGLATRVSALTLLGTMFIAVFFAHSGDPFKKMELGLCYLFMASLLMALGAGRYSLDALLSKKLT